MATLHSFGDGGYAFLEGGFPYSAGVVALPGFEIVRARLRRVLPMADGFAAIDALLRAAGRPRTALCAAELRSPQPFSFDGFGNFNKGYVAVLEQWGLVRNGLNPVARSNVCPEFDAPSEPGFFAFCYTVPAGALTAGVASGTGLAQSFVVAGSGEWPEGTPFPDRIVARGDTSPAGLSAKAQFVLEEMRRRTDGLGADWNALTSAQIYTVHDIHPLLRPQLHAAGLTRLGLDWHVCRPPIRELEYEMDVRGVRMELMIG